MNQFLVLAVFSHGLSQNDPVEGVERDREKGERRLSDISPYKDANLIRSGLRPHLTLISS